MLAQDRDRERALDALGDTQCFRPTRKENEVSLHGAQSGLARLDGGLAAVGRDIDAVHGAKPKPPFTIAADGGQERRQALAGLMRAERMKAQRWRPARKCNFSSFEIGLGGRAGQRLRLAPETACMLDASAVADRVKRRQFGPLRLQLQRAKDGKVIATRITVKQDAAAFPFADRQARVLVIMSGATGDIPVPAPADGAKPGQDGGQIAHCSDHDANSSGKL